MNKSIIIAILALLLLIVADHYLVTQTEQQRVLHSQVRALPGNENRASSDVWWVEIGKQDTIWRYQKKQGNWVYPAYENAFVLKDRFDAFLRDVVESKGTFLTIELEPRFGFEPEALTVHLADSTKVWKQDIQIGSSLPGIDTEESYMKLTSGDSIFHVHADPNKDIISNRQGDFPPFIDTKILPTALQRRSIKEVIFVNSQTSVDRLDRVEIEKQVDRPQIDGPTYQWYAQVSGKRMQVVNASVYTYLSFLSRMQYTNLLDPTQLARNNSKVILIDDQDTADTLEVSTQQHRIRHQTTGHLYEVQPAQFALLFPTSTLLDSLPKNNPYRNAGKTSLTNF